MNTFPLPWIDGAMKLSVVLLPDQINVEVLDYQIAEEKAVGHELRAGVSHGCLENQAKTADAVPAPLSISWKRAAD